jgi:hypothetical protein
MNFDIDSTGSKNLLKYLKIVEKHNFLFHLLIMMQSNELNESADQYYIN